MVACSTPGADPAMRRIGSVVLMAVWVLTGCGSGGEDADAVGPGSGDAAVDLTTSGVGIIAEGCSLVAQLGSGAVVAAPDQVVTVAHTIAGASSITVVDGSGTSHAATVRAFDADADLAVLDVAGLDAAPLALAETVTPGRASFVTWDRDDGITADDVEITRRLSITIEDIYIDDTVERSGFEIAGEVVIGDSGGAVVNDDGQVVGVVYANSRGRDRIGFATDVTEISALLLSVDDDVDNGTCL